MRNFFITVVAAFLMLTAAGCANDYRHLEGMVWNTTFHITYQSDKDLTDSIFAAISEVGASLNVFDESSLVSRVNRNDSTAVDDNFSKVYEMSERICRASGGAFDPTLGPLIEAWGFGRGHKATADTLRIDSMLALTGMDKTMIKDKIIYKTARGLQFNFSAIAKGYGCDRVVEILKRNGVMSCLVEIGGEIRCVGHSPRQREWQISIDKPILTDSLLHESQCVIAVTDAGVATSGNYRNFHKRGGETYGHTISAKTGRPVQTDVLSATVIASTAMEADALATAIMAMGSVEGMKLARQFDAAAMIVLSDGSIRQNEKFERLLQE